MRKLKPLLFLIILLTINFIMAWTYHNGRIDIETYKFIITVLYLGLFLIFWLVKPNNKYIILYITAIVYSIFEAMEIFHYYEKITLPLSLIFLILTIITLYKTKGLD